MAVMLSLLSLQSTDQVEMEEHDLKVDIPCAEYEQILGIALNVN